VSNGLRFLSTEDARVVVLEIVPLSSFSSPTPVVEGQPNEEFALARGTCFFQNLGARYFSLTDEEGSVG